MAELVDECVSEALRVLNLSSCSNRELILKREQQIAVKDLLLGKDVLAVLPTGYGKSLIFMLFLLAREEMSKRSASTVPERNSVLVVSPLRSIISDQISEVTSLNCSALELSGETVSVVINSPPQFIYCSAESALENDFLAGLKNSNSPIHQSLAAIVVDESHTVETWTGKRNKRDKSHKDGQAFRDAYGKLSMLRSMCKEGAPVLALTGTADQETQRVICSTLSLRNATKLFVSPNRSNLRFDINKVPKKLMLSKLDWIIEMIKTGNIGTPKTIIFCDTIYALTHVVNYLTMQLGKFAFHPTTSKKREDCLLGIFHSMTQDKYKTRILDSLKVNGNKRVVIATSALSMGVNFPDIKYVIMYGLPRNLLDLHQQAGRAGRDGFPAHVALFYYGQQVSHVEDEMRVFLNSTGCFRVASYIKFDASISPHSPGHNCCNFCAELCTCGSVDCKQIKISHEQCSVTVGLSSMCRSVSEEDKNLIREALEAHQEILSSNNVITALGSISCHGFSHKLFSLNDVINYVPVFSETQAMNILSIINEIFSDIDETTFIETGNYSDIVFQQFSLNDLLVGEFTDINLDPELPENDFV